MALEIQLTAVALWILLIAALLLINWFFSKSTLEIGLGFVLLVAASICFIVSFVIQQNTMSTLTDPSFKLLLAILFQLSIIGGIILFYMKAMEPLILTGWMLTHALLVILFLLV
jgi:hypothetical protein